MNTKPNRMFMIRRKAVAGILATGAGLSINFATAPSSFAANLSLSNVNSTALKMKAPIKNSQITLKTSKIAGKNAKATLKNYALKTNAQPTPLAAATFTAFLVTTTSNPRPDGDVAANDVGRAWLGNRTQPGGDVPPTVSQAGRVCSVDHLADDGDVHRPCRVQHK